MLPKTPQIMTATDGGNVGNAGSNRRQTLPSR